MTLPKFPSPRPEDLVVAFFALASERGPEFAGVAMFAYLTKNLGASADSPTLSANNQSGSRTATRRSGDDD